MVRVKICGITNQKDAEAAADAGADAIGFVFAKSPRRVVAGEARKISRALGSRVMKVGVFVDEPISNMLRSADHCLLDAIQLHGNEETRTIHELQKNGYRVLKAVRFDKNLDMKEINDISADALLFDTVAAGRFGGTGQSFDWEALSCQKIRVPWFVSGGLHAKNVKRMLSILTPYGVDVSSGVEASPGKKNKKLVKEFIQNAKSS